MKNQASLESVTYLFDVLEFGCIRKRRLDKLYKELEGEQSRKRGDDWYMRSNKMRIKQTNSEVLLLFAIVEFLAWGMWFYTKESIGIIMGVSFIIIMLLEWISVCFVLFHVLSVLPEVLRSFGQSEERLTDIILIR